MPVATLMAGSYRAGRSPALLHRICHHSTRPLTCIASDPGMHWVPSPRCPERTCPVVTRVSGALGPASIEPALRRSRGGRDTHGVVPMDMGKLWMEAGTTRRDSRHCRCPDAGGWPLSGRGRLSVELCNGGDQEVVNAAALPPLLREHDACAGGHSTARRAASAKRWCLPPVAAMREGEAHRTASGETTAGALPPADAIARAVRKFVRSTIRG